MMIHQNLLDEGKIEDLVAALRSIDSSSPELAEKSASRSDTLQTIPSACATPNFAVSAYSLALASSKLAAKTIIGSRCKQSGMFWTVRGANAILALR
jgi:hypothetical protein